MTVTKTTTTKITLSLDELPVDMDLEYEPTEWIDPVVTVGENGVYTVAYAVADDDVQDYYWQEGVSFYNSDQDDISPHTKSEAEEAEHIFHVERYDHGLVKYVLVDESNADNRHWDVSLLGFSGDFIDPKTAARAILAEYTSWANGDVYGIVKQTFDYQGNEVGDTDLCWGFIGSEYAESVVKDIDSHL